MVLLRLDGLKIEMDGLNKLETDTGWTKIESFSNKDGSKMKKSLDLLENMINNIIKIMLLHTTAD